LLDEIGQNINNDELNQKFCKNKNVYLIIGGPYGVDKAVKQRANFIFALGKLIYPYELVRLIIVEQIYRSQMINSNHPYHHD
jgi:23S rRNA (pseudouridine1915-N3)-methyltransferase